MGQAEGWGWTSDGSVDVVDVKEAGAGAPSLYDICVREAAKQEVAKLLGY